MTTAIISSVGSVTLRSVHAAHAGRPVLTDLDLDLERGRLTLLVGPNGSGKSTLLAVLAGTHPVSSGVVSQPPGMSIGFVPQRSAVPDRLPLSVREVVSMGRWGRGSRSGDRAIVDESLEALGLSDLAGRPLSALSGGQRQRAFVAQGLARRADLLLLDEPTAAVDVEAQALIRAAVAGEVVRGAMVVEASHDASLRGPGVEVVELAHGRRAR